MNDVTLDGLTIEIESSAGSSSVGIDNLTASLDRLFVSVSKNMSGLNRLANSLKGINASTKSFGKLKVDTPNISSMSFGNTTGSLIDTEKTNKNLDTTVKELQKVQGLKNSINKLPLDIVSDRTLDKVKNLQVQTKKLGNVSLQKVNMGGTISASKSTEKSISRIGREADRTSLKLSTMINNFKKGLSVASTIGSTFGKVLSSIGKKLSFGLIPANKSLIKSFRQTVLALVGVRGLFTAIRKAISEYMNYDDALSESLRQNWAIIGSVVAPIIERLVSLVATLASYIATFIKTFFGVDIVARANEKALNGTSKSAKGAAKSVKDLNDELGNIADFDKLHTIDFPTDSGSSGSSGGVAPLSTVDVDTSWIDELKSYIDVDDYFALGVAVATKLEEGLRSIKWENIQGKLIEITDNIVDFLNGFTAKIDGKLIGYNIAQAFNTAFNTVNEFFNKYHWDWFGDKLHESFKSTIENIDWNSIGIFLSNGFKAAIDITYELFDPNVWYDLGSGIGTAVNKWFDNINWEKAGQSVTKGIQSIAKTIQGTFDKLDANKASKAINDFVTNTLDGMTAKDVSDAIKKLLDKIGDVISGLDTTKITSSVITFIGNMDWFGIAVSLVRLLFKFIVFALPIGWAAVIGEVAAIIKSIFTVDTWKMIHDSLVSLKQKIEHKILEIVQGVIDGICNLLGIHSPSTVFENIGHNIVQGLINGIGNVWDKIKAPFITLGTKVSEVFSRISDTIKTTFNPSNLGQIARSAVDGIKQAFGKIPDWFKNTFTEAWRKVKEVFSSSGEIFTGIKDGMSEAFSRIANKLRDGFNTVIAKPFNVMNRVLNKIKDFEILNIKPFYNAWGYDPIGVPQIPALATGTNKIISEGIYHLHEGESVVPKKYNPAVNSGIYDKANEKLIDKMDTMIKVMKSLEFTSITKIGDDDIYKKQTIYNRRKQDIYGTS